MAQKVRFVKLSDLAEQVRYELDREYTAEEIVQEFTAIFGLSQRGIVTAQHLTVQMARSEQRIALGDVTWFLSDKPVELQLESPLGLVIFEFFDELDDEVIAEMPEAVRAKWEAEVSGPLEELLS